MGSDKRKRGDDRNRGGSTDPRRRRTSPPALEGLEDRRLLAQVGWQATSSDPYDVQHGPLANLGQTLISVYKDFATNGSKVGYTPSLKNLVQFRGNNMVGVDVIAAPGVNLPTLGATLTQLGMQLTSAWAANNVAEGYIPIANLPKLASSAVVRSASPIFKPTTFATANGYPFQGAANNQSANTLNVPTQVVPGVVNGTGQRIGVLSDSVDFVGGGIADSIRTGDLAVAPYIVPGQEGVGEDEGRAMLEQIHDIVPGAQLGYATATTGQVAFANNILSLAQAGFNTIVDDIGYADDPAFQDGVVSQAVNTVTATGNTYLSAAGNSSDAGYLSQFRGVSASVGSLGAGRYMNFDGTGATTTTQLGFYVEDRGAPPEDRPSLFFQWDQPFYGGATSNITAYLLDANGNIAYQGIDNTGATGRPYQVLLSATDPTSDTAANIAPGNYTFVVKINSGPDPGFVRAYSFSNSVAFDKKFGSAGGTYYPTTVGHNSGRNTISVGAVPYYGAAPYVSTTTNNNEPFSSFGPVVNSYNPDGTPKQPEVLLKPDISGADGNNTSFFGDPAGIPTTVQRSGAAVSYPGNPPTTVPSPTTAINYNQNLPNFYGTSSAAPNVAAVVALMKQVNPGVTRASILRALQTTATPLNGSAQGAWNPQGGYGLVNATSAVAQVSVLQVNSVSPGVNATITAAPSAITVSFSKAIILSSIQATTLQVAGPNGSTVVVGTPVGVDNPTTPTVVSFPITIVPAPGRPANGKYSVLVNAGTVVGIDGTVLSNSLFDTFNLQSVAPTVAGTAINGRVFTVTFSSQVNPATINAGNVIVFRAGGVTNPLINPANVLVSQLPGAVVSYNPANLTATIDLTNVPQAFLPTDRYGIAVTTNVTDAVGNPLNGAFSGVFPSGVATPSGLGSNFYQDLGVLVVQPPTISSLVLNPNTDTGFPGDFDTANPRPGFIGQVGAVFPATNANLLVYVQFNGINHTGLPQGGLNLAPGAGGRSVVGQYDAVVRTDANGVFVVNYPAGVAPLPEGQNIVRVVVVGATDAGGAGLATSFDQTFTIDNTRPYIGTLNGTSPTSVPQGASINSLSTLSINIIDPVNPQSRTSPFAVSPQAPLVAVNPSSVTNLSNFNLYRVLGPGQLLNVSNFIAGATFVSTSARVLPSDPFTGQIVLSFSAGLPQGNYTLVVRSNTDGYAGVTDQAGNAIASSAANSASGRASQFALDFRVQPTPTYITGYSAYSDNGAGNIFGVQSGPRASYEVPVAGIAPGAPAPPVAWTIDFSNQLATVNPDGTPRDYAKDVVIARSANSAAGNSDGDFGNFGTVAGLTNPTGFTVVPGVNVQLVNSIDGATYGQFGYLNRLLISLPPGTSLTPDYYRFYLPNTTLAVNNAAFGSRTFTPINDAFGNQLDGEFLGYQNSNGKYVNQLNDGTTRGSGAFDVPDLTGDGVAGGAFVTGFVVVPNGNVIYARPDAIYNPQLPGSYPDGTQANPYPVLAPEAVPNAINGGDLNSPLNAGINFNPTYDRSGIGTFQPSAFFAAQEKARLTLAPVVIVAQPALLTRDPITGVVSQRPFVLQSPITIDQQNTNDASAAIPAMTTLIFAQGSTLKMQNAALLVQNQGSALQILGGPNPSQIVTVTSYRDSSVGGATNGDPSSIPASGDYGGILFRNFNQAAGNGGAGRISLFPGQIPITGSNVSDGRLKGQFNNPADRNSQSDAISGADSVMSYINFLVEKYAGGVVPNVTGFAYDGITLQNSRPTIVNSSITLSGGTGAAQAGLSADFDSLLQDDVASGPLVRNVNFAGNGLNGILIRALVGSGTAQPSNATVVNAGAGGTPARRNYVINNPYPYLLTSRLVLGQQQLVETGGAQAALADRLYVAPGMIVKVIRGGGIDVSGAGSINTGDRTYINQFDAGTDNPALPGFRANSAALANALFTSLNDDVATTTYTDPATGQVRTVVAALPALPNGAGANQPTVGNVPAVSRWGGIFVASGSIAVLNSTIFRFGGGSINTSTGTGTRHVLEVGGSDFGGANISVTNNTFVANADVPINTQAGSWFAGDATRPLVSGNPFIRGNVFLNNDINGVGVAGGTPGPLFPSNLNHSSIWTGSDFTYVLRSTIILGPVSSGGLLPTPSSTGFVPEPTPSVVLTLQSTLPGTLLADGTVVAGPGIPLIIKTLSSTQPYNATPQQGVNPVAGIGQDYQGGAGFIAGVDDGIDPPAVNYLVDNGASSQLRILGIGGNASTGQARVPVIITSLYDNTVGTTVNGVVQNQAISGAGREARAGDGGIISFGANSLTSYSITDLRSGSVIDNADIKYMTRIEQQDGGLIYATDFNGDNTINGLDNPFGVKTGTAGFQYQYNTSRNLMISNSNLSTFSDGGIFSYASSFSALNVTSFTNPVTGQTTTSAGRLTAYNGEPNHLFLVNNTISNMTSGRAAGVQVYSQTGDSSGSSSVGSQPAVVVALNNTFYNNTTGIDIWGAPAGAFNQLAHVSLLAMNSIFSNNGVTNADGTTTGGAIIGHNQVYGSDSQYNLFYQNATTVSGGVANSNPYTGDPAFRNPLAGDFNLKSNSAAIDRSRDQLGPSYFGDILYPAATIINTNLNTIPVRNNTGNTYPFGGYQFPLQGLTNPGVVTLPGLPVTERQFPDQWTATLTTAPPTAIIPATAVTNTTPGTPGTSYVPNGTYAYSPIFGQRDILGNRRLRVIDSPNPPGFGSTLGLDLGAYEYQNQFPPVVTSVVAAGVDGSYSNLYVAGGVGGTNKYPNAILVGVNTRLNPATLSGNSVFLVGSGGDGTFGNADDINYNLTNRVSFDNTLNAIVINTAGLLPTGAALNDEYRLTLKGTGSAIIRDTRGVALDGSTNNGAAALPSGVDRFPGSDFNVRFTIDTNPPTLVAGTFGLAPGSFNTAAATAGANAAFPITNDATPTFVGRITDIFPPSTPLAGSAVFVDIATAGTPDNPIFNLPNAATGFTDANGNFSVTVAAPLPTAAVNVGPDGKQGTSDDTGYYYARVRIVDQAGNTTLLPGSPLSQFAAAGALLPFEVDTTPPRVLALSPTANALASAGANGNVTVTATISKNIDPTTLNANSVQVFRAGGSGTFNGAGIPVTIVPGSFAINYLGGVSGQVQVTFQLQGPLPNDFYRIVLKGTGTTPIRDIAGNALDGLGTGVPGSGDYTNGSFTVFSPANSRLLYVGASATYVTTPTGVQGTRGNPFPTIAAGLAAAQTGDYVVVLPGTYRENVQLKSQVRLVSGSINSTDTAFTPGNPIDTIIYGNTSGNLSSNATTGITVVQGLNLTSVAGLPTEISGFTILVPLLGDSVRGTIDPTSVAVSLTNADVMVDRNFIVNAGLGIGVGTTGANVSAPRIFDNVIAGNIYGIVTTDTGSTTSYARPTQVYNNTIAYNTYGFFSISSLPNVNSAIVVNDIFYNNHDLTSARNGTGVYSTSPNTVYVGYSLFYANGVSGAPSSNAIGTFNFNVAALTGFPDQSGNLLADPAFVNPLDPRPDGNSAPTFFNYANFDLTSRSAAINGALNYAAPATDILYRSPVSVPGKGVFGTGPASIGAYYFRGTGGASTVVTVGVPPTSTDTGTTNPGNDGEGTTSSSAPGNTAAGTVSALSLASNAGTRPIGTRAFTVVNSSLDPDGTGTPGIAQAIVAPTTIDLNFSDNVDRSSITPSDLVLSGTGLDAANPAHAAGLTWVDDHTVRFLLAGGFKADGSVKVSIAPGAIKDTDGTALDAFAESFQLGSTAESATSAAAPATVTLPVVQPVAVAGPVAVHYGHGKKGQKPHAAKMKAAAAALAQKKEAAAAKAKAQAQAKAQQKAGAHKAQAQKAAAKNGKHAK